MALSVFSTGGTASALTPASPFNFTIVCGGTNSILIVVLGYAPAVITGVTYNGVAMTLVRTDSNASVGKTSIFYLVNPSSGSNTVAVSHTGNPSQIVGGGICLENALQTGQPDNSGTFQVNATSNSSVSLAVVQKAAIIDVVTTNGTETVVAPSVEFFNLGSGAGIKVSGSYRLVNTADTYSMNWTDSISTKVQTAASFKSNSGNGFQINTLRPAIFVPGNTR